MPTLRQLEYLVAIADLRHFGRAAAACHVSQPTLSQQLRTLEERLGVALVERRLAGAELTPIGREIAERARGLLVEAKDLRDLARRAADGAAGTIRLGVTPTLGPYLLPPIVAALHREQPDLKLYIREGIPDDQSLELARGQIDMLVGPLPIEGEGLTLEPFVPGAAAAGRTRRPPARPRPRHPRGAGRRPILSLDRRHHLHRQVAGSAPTTACGCCAIMRHQPRQHPADGRLGPRPRHPARLLHPLRIGRARSACGSSRWRVERDPQHRCRWRAGAAYAQTYEAIARRVQEVARGILGADLR
jgi:LysR family hydrogen peroxide-inducible transcriptional activator